jgi:hypothetical protein
MKHVKQYNETHPYCHVRGRSLVTWLGDPARGEFAPREKQKTKRKGKR